MRHGAPAHWQGDRRQTTLWEIPTVNAAHGTRDDAATPHGTQKPVALLAKALANHAGDVYDPFLDRAPRSSRPSSSGARAYAMDIDPAYVQVALERWQAYSGAQAERI